MTRHAFCVLASLLYCAFFSSNVRAADFDCNLAATTSERLICNDPDIRKLDADLMYALRENRATYDPRFSTKVKPCKNKACIITLYQRQIAHVRQQKTTPPTALGLPRFEAETMPSAASWFSTVQLLGLKQFPEKAAAMSDEEALRYARKFLPPDEPAGEVLARRCSSMFPCDQFKLKDAAAAFRDKRLAAALEKAPSLPWRFVRVERVLVAPYDGKRGGFPLGDMIGPKYLSFFGSQLDAPLPQLWPASEEQARAFAARRRPDDRTLLVAVTASINGVKKLRESRPASGSRDQFQTNTGLPPGYAWELELESFALYEDEALTKPLHKFGASPRLASPLIGTPSADDPRPTGPLNLDLGESPLLLLLCAGALAPEKVDWKAAAHSRLAAEGNLRKDLDYAKSDAWGVFFDREHSAAILTQGEVSAYRQWTEKRAANLPEFVEFQGRMSFEKDAKDIQPLKAPPDPSLKAAPWLNQLALSPDQSVQITAFNAPVKGVRFFAPAATENYRIKRPGNLARGTAQVRIEARVDGVETIDKGKGQSDFIVRLQPTSARILIGDKVLASASFPRSEWAAPAPPQAPPPAVQGPGPEARIANGAYGPDVLGIRLGMDIEEAEAIIRKHMNVVGTLETRSRSGPTSGPAAHPSVARTLENRPGPTSNPASRPSKVHGKIFVGNDRPRMARSEQIAIYDAPHAPGKVIAVWRSIYLNDGSWPSVLKQLNEKYGPGKVQGSLVSWSAQNGQNCNVAFARWPAWASSPAIPAREFASVDVPTLPNPEAKQQDLLADCGPTVRISQGQSRLEGDLGHLYRMDTALFDLGVLAWLTGRYEAEAPGAKPSVKTKL